MPNPPSPPTPGQLSSRVWIVPINDGEAVEIVGLLEALGERHLVSRQRHGATWANLEPELQSELVRLRAVEPGCSILGVEFAGPNPYGAANIDHHCYSDDDRSNERSSLEQCAAILGVALDRHQLLVAINDRAWIPGLEAAGASPGEIAAIRAQDLVAQGLGLADRARAESDLRTAQWLGDLALVTCPGGANSYHNDLLYGRATAALLMAPQLWSYSGPLHIELVALDLPEKHWSGGAQARGYFCVERPSPASRQRILRLLCGEPPSSLELLS